MSLESKLPLKVTYNKEDLLFDTSYALTIISYISPLTLGAYSGVTDATNTPHPPHLSSALAINALGITTLVALNSNGKKVKYATLGALSAAITAPVLYSIGYGIGYSLGKIVY